MGIKRDKREARREARRVKRDDTSLLDSVPALSKAKVTQLEPRTEMQKRYISAIRSFKLVYGLGPAGTGKTYIAGAMAAAALLDNRTEKIIITRPAVDAGESLGFLPGELEEKYAPYIQPFRDVLNERIGTRHVENLLKNGRIEAAPLAYMRGRTFKNAFVILDEAQNTTPEQMKLFLTRIGEGCTVIVNGDESQADLRGLSGLSDAVARTGWIPSVKIIRFSRSDIVRSGLVQEIVESYENPVPPR
jgi:phosphate starvation-inducible PhoH-like protein